jgi:hypothetical protein
LSTTATLSSFDDWVKESFTDWDKLLPGDSICSDCLFWFDESSETLMQRVGKDRPQKMRNYSHFIVNGDWIPCSKADKARVNYPWLKHGGLPLALRGLLRIRGVRPID